MQRVDESRLDDFPMQDLPADRRWMTFGIGSLVLSLACGLIVPKVRRGRYFWLQRAVLRRFYRSDEQT